MWKDKAFVVLIKLQTDVAKSNLKPLHHLDKSMIAKKIIRVSIVVLIVVFIWKFLIPEAEVRNLVSKLLPGKRHIYDEAGILPQYDVKKFEEYLNWVFEESDIDIRFVFIKNTADKTIEEIAVEKIQALRIGGENREERGLLLLYDLDGKRLRIEVGYGLEYYFPDSFVGYLVHDHTRDFFSSGDLTTGLRLLIRLLQHRIREEVLGKNFDPRVIEIIRHGGYLSGGAGVTSVMPEIVKTKLRRPILSDEKIRRSYSAQPTPKAAYEKYLEWLAAQNFYPKIGLFTIDTQKHLASFPMTRAYFHYILIQEYGRKYKIAEKNNLAILYFVDDPLVCPHFFIKTPEGWRMDMAAEVNNIRSRVGGIYIWDYRGRNDIYTKNFIDKFVNIKNYIRIVDGDNRELPTRKSS